MAAVGRHESCEKPGPTSVRASVNTAAAVDAALRAGFCITSCKAAAAQTSSTLRVARAPQRIAHDTARRRSATGRSVGGSAASCRDARCSFVCQAPQWSCSGAAAAAAPPSPPRQPMAAPHRTPPPRPAAGGPWGRRDRQLRQRRPRGAIKNPADPRTATQTASSTYGILCRGSYSWRIR